MRPMYFLYFAALVLLTSCELMPRNTFSDCKAQCKTSGNPNACLEFCACIHKNCRSLNECLADYEKAKVTANRKP